MARPKKENADYFSHDADMRNDNKIKAVRRKFGLKGYAIWCMILEHLTDCNNFDYEITDLNIELMAGDFDIDPIELKEIINYFISLKLLEEDCNFIYSNQLLKRFDSLLNKRKGNRNAYKNGFQTPETPNKEVSDVENPQSKVNESKVNESKGDSLKEESEILKFSEKLFNDSEWLESVLRMNKLKPDESFKILNFLKLFDLKLASEMETKINKQEYASHFSRWLSLELKKVKTVNGKEKQTGAQAFENLVYGTATSI